MLFRQSDLAYDPIQEASNILNESVYLDESESITSAKAIPVVENSRIGAYIVRFNDVSCFAEDHGVSYEDAMNVIAESNDIDTNNLAVAVKETTIMANPGIVNELNNVVVTPLPQTDAMYQFTEACVDAFIESGDTSYMDLLVEGSTIINDKDGSSLHYTHDGYAWKHNKDSNLVARDKDGMISYRTAGGRLFDFANKAASRKDDAKSAMNNEQSKIKKLLKTIKYYGYDTPKERIATALKTLIIKYNIIVRNVPNDPSRRKWNQSLLKVIDTAIIKLTKFLNKCEFIYDVVTDGSEYNIN